jgi:hypothetical protein
MPLAYTRPKPPLPSFQTSRLPLRPWIRSVWILLASTSTRETLPPNVQQTGPDFLLLSLRCCPPTSLPRQLPPRTTRHVRFAHSTVSRHRPGLYPPLESPSPRSHTSTREPAHRQYVRTPIPASAPGLLDAIRLSPPHHAANVPRPRRQHLLPALRSPVRVAIP